MAGEWHGRGMGAAWARHAMCESALNVSERSTYNAAWSFRGEPSSDHAVTTAAWGSSESKLPGSCNNTQWSVKSTAFILFDLFNDAYTASNVRAIVIF